MTANRMKKGKYEAIVIGVSAGGMDALRKIIPLLPSDFSASIIVVQHLHPQSDDFLAIDLDKKSRLTVKQADEKEKLMPGLVYFAPPNYHLLIENNKTFSLSICDMINYARPSIDILFETAAETFQEKLIGIVLTGANRDGCLGAKKIKECGGMVIVQDPNTAEVQLMPRSVIESVKVDYVLPLDNIAHFLIEHVQKEWKKA